MFVAVGGRYRSTRKSFTSSMVANVKTPKRFASMKSIMTLQDGTNANSPNSDAPTKVGTRLNLTSGAANVMQIITIATMQAVIWNGSMTGQSMCLRFAVSPIG
jgi:hypothetical protein